MVRGVKVFYVSQGEFFEVVVFDIGCDEGYWDIFLDMVDMCLWWYKSQDVSNEVDEVVGCVVFVFFCFLQFVEICFMDDEGRINFQIVSLEIRVFKVFFELVQVVFYFYVGKIRYYVGNDFEFGVFGKVECFCDGGNSVIFVCVMGNVFVEGLYVDFEMGVVVVEYVCQVIGEIVIWFGFDCDVDVFDIVLFVGVDGFVDVGCIIFGKGIVKLGDKFVVVGFGK